VLRACKRLLRPGGRTAFFTIHPAPGLTRAQRRRASRDGPVAVAATRSHRQLLASARFTDIAEVDYTAEFAATTRAWIAHHDAHRTAVVQLIGEEAFAQRQSERRAQLAAIDDGLLRRSLLIATRRGRWGRGPVDVP